MNLSVYYAYDDTPELEHHGIKGQKWGVRRYQNPDGSLTTEGRLRYGSPKGKDFRNTLKIVGSIDKFSRKNGRFNSGKAMGMLPDSNLKDLLDMSSFYGKEIDKVKNNPYKYNRYGRTSYDFGKDIESIGNEFADTALSYLKSSGMAKNQILAGKALIEQQLYGFNRETLKNYR